MCWTVKYSFQKQIDNPTDGAKKKGKGLPSVEPAAQLLRTNVKEKNSQKWRDKVKKSRRFSKEESRERNGLLQ